MTPQEDMASAVGREAVEPDEPLQVAVPPIPEWVHWGKNDPVAERRMRSLAAYLTDEEDAENAEGRLLYQQSVEHLPGLVGDIARYIYASSYLPVHEMAVTASLALMAGICGRGWHTRTMLGLNVYLMLLAKTGRGKEGMQTGVSAIVDAVRSNGTDASRFIGPSEFASGQALIRRLDENPCFVSIFGEFGLTLKAICDRRANPSQVMLRKVLLNTYTKSGPRGTLEESAYSDTSKNTKSVHAPSVTILGESNPVRFFEGLTQDNVIEGLVPRFTFIEHIGDRPEENSNCNIDPPSDLVNRVRELVIAASNLGGNRNFVAVNEDSEAQAVFTAFRAEARVKINGENELDAAIWTRAEGKVAKFAALVAVGCNMATPMVTGLMARWAVQFVRQDIACITSRFARGELGSREEQQEADIRRAIAAYLRMSAAQRAAYKVPIPIQTKAIMPYGFLRRRLQRCKAFTEDPRGFKNALSAMLDDLCRADALRLIHVGEAQSEYGCSQPLYELGSAWRR